LLPNNDDLPGNAAALTKVNLKAVRSAVAKEEKGKDRQKLKSPKAKSQAK